LLSPQSQPHGFLIANRPIAISFADPAAFEPASAGPLGGQFLLRSTRNGGIGSDTIGKSEGGWCAYANEQAGAVETVPAKGQAISEDGSLPEMTPQLRSFLGVFAGKRSDEVETAPSSLPTGGIVNIANVMQPIKIGTTFGAALGKGKKEEGYTPRKNLFGDEEETDLVGKDTVLLSRSKSFIHPGNDPADTRSQRSPYSPTHIW
jgi:RNA-binding protein 5/10